MLHVGAVPPDSPSSSPWSASSAGPLSAADRREPWAWFERGRGVTPYQPVDDDGATPDPNGCRAKLAMLRAAPLDLSGAAVVSFGAHSGYYEYHLARLARDVRALHLVDTSATALAAARARCAPLSIADCQTFECPAARFSFARNYDICLLLSVWHHYDRLGATLRARGIELLRAIGRHCRVLAFETGQSDDRQRGAEHWPLLLDMATAPTPADWIERQIPAWTGYDAWRCLGANPATGRLLYLFYRRDV